MIVHEHYLTVEYDICVPKSARRFYCEIPNLLRYRGQISNTPTVNGACSDISKDTSY